MNIIKSCGFIAYKMIDGKRHYLIIKGINGDVGYPKGHTEQGETELETAHRELYEETGVRVEAIEGFRHEIEYSLPKAKDTIKRVVYFLGRIEDDNIVCQQSEVTEARLITAEEALRALTFDSARQLIREAEGFLKSRAH